jgi:U3 small nucleolar RNA-associated protein 21
MDCSIRTWDMATGRLVDILRVPAAPVSLSFSPSGDYLATAHVDDLGIFLWANRMQFEAVTLKPLTAADEDSEAAVTTALPSRSLVAKDASADSEGVRLMRQDGC